MNPENPVNIASSFANAHLIPFGWKILGAIAVWIVGSWIVRLIAAAWSGLFPVEQLIR